MTARPLFVAGLCLMGVAPACGGSDTASIRAAAESCAEALEVDEVGELASDGESIGFDTKGEDDPTGDSLESMVCVLSKLDVSDFILARMEQTRALDGQQQAEWDRYQVTWIYHPDSGFMALIADA